jgi:hypothetical protein
MRPCSHYACGVVSCCLVSASLAFLISLESRPASAIPCDEVVLPGCVKVDWFQNAWRWGSNSRRGSAPPSLLFDCGQVQAGVSFAIHGGSESQVRTWHGNDVCNSSHCLPPNAAAFSSRTVLWSSRPDIHVESVYPVSCQRRTSCGIPAKAERTPWPAVRRTG